MIAAIRPEVRAGMNETTLLHTTEMVTPAGSAGYCTVPVRLCLALTP